MNTNPRLKRQARKARSSTDAKLNITSMMDMFTIILVFLLKSFSAQGQLVTPATGLILPASTVQRGAQEALSIKISRDAISVEDRVVIDSRTYNDLLKQDAFKIDSLYRVLTEFAEQGKNAAKRFGKEFPGDITIQGDVEVPYSVLTRIMYTCGQAGFPNMNLIVYRKE